MTTATATNELEEPEGACSREGCPIAQGGACLAGHAETIDCDFFELVPDDVEVVAAPEVRRVPLSDGEALRPSELHRVLRSHPTSIVVPLGRVDAGKTTLLALAYQLVRAGRTPSLKFAGSSTILGWARRAHHASFASGRVQPVTPRTAREESGLLLHLNLRSEDDIRLAVVFSDVSGEHVEDITSGVSVEVVVDALRIADHIPIVVDGRGLADPDRRSLTVLQTRTLLKMLEKAERKPAACISLVITKADLLLGTDIAEATEAICRGTLAEGCPTFETADRASVGLDDDDEPLVPLGAGVAGFLQHVCLRDSGPMVEGATSSRVPAPSPLLARLWDRA